MLSEIEKSRYIRSLMLPEIGMQGQEKIKNAKVLVVGAGGIGCPAIQYLAAAGVGTLGVADFDKVDVTNLQRQILFNEQSIGKSKTLEAGKKIEGLNQFVNVKIHESKIDLNNAPGIFADYDLILDGTDTLVTRHAISVVCKKLQKPHVYGAVHGFEGQLAVFNYEGSSAYHEFFFGTTQETIPNCNTMGILGTVPGFIGVLLANEAIKILVGAGEILNGRMLLANLLTLSFQIIELQIKKADSRNETILY